MKKEVISSNIQTNHTYAEYQRYFSHLLAKGKIHRYALDETYELDPRKQYWKITDDEGKTYYYELPKYIKPDYSKSAYSTKRVLHRRPARAVIAIFAGVAILSFTSMVITRNIFVTPPVPPQPIDLDAMQKKLKEFQDWLKVEPDGDATKKFTVNDLANIAMANALYDSNSYHEEGGKGWYDRRPLLTVGYGGTVSMSVIEVSVTNSFTYNGADALEESISFSDSILPIVPKVGRRDFFVKESNTVHSNSGTASGKTTIKWNAEDDKKEKSKDEYEEEVGKIPDNPFLYSIDEETVLEGSIASKSNDGYQITINLDVVKGVARYTKRMKYLSGKTIDRFKSVEITLITNNNLSLISQSVNERYDVHDDFLGGIDTIGKLKTAFYYDNVPDIPDRVTPFDYSKYPEK